MRKTVLVAGLLLTGALPLVGQGAWTPAPDGWVNISSIGTLPAGYLTIQEEGADLPQQGILNFIGASVTCADNPGDASTDCTFTGGGGGAPDDADFLIGTVNVGLANGIVVGTSPGGELGGTWGSPTIDDGISITNITLVNPALGTPASGVLTNATGLPVATGISGLGAGVAAWLATPSSANLATAVTGESGSGALVFGTAPALTTPNLIQPTTSNGATSAGHIFFLEDTDNGSNTVQLIGPASTADVVLTLPAVTATVATTGTNTWDDGVTQVFNPDATNSGLNVGSVAGDPSSADNGDIWYDSGSNELTAQINGSPVALGSGGGASTQCPGPACIYLFDDFSGDTATNGARGEMANWLQTIRNSAPGGATDASVVDANHWFVLDQSTGANVAGGVSMTRMRTGAELGTGAWYVEFLIQIPDLSDANDTYLLRFGLCDQINGSDCTDGLYFEYDSTTSANWLMKSADGGTRTETASSEAVVADAWIKARVAGDAAGTTIDYLINGVSIGTVTTNLPDDSDAFGPFIQIEKAGGAVGTNPRSVLIDYFELKKLVTR